MPTYDYKCDACGHAFEKIQSITSAPLRKCPKCGKNKVKRLVGTGVGVIFKGSGFYTTDYRSESYKSAAKADSGATAPASGEGTSSADAKPSGDAKPSSDAKPAAKEPSKSKPAAKTSDSSGKS